MKSKKAPFKAFPRLNLFTLSEHHPTKTTFRSTTVQTKHKQHRCNLQTTTALTAQTCVCAAGHSATPDRLGCQTTCPQADAGIITILQNYTACIPAADGNVTVSHETKTTPPTAFIDDNDDEEERQSEGEPPANTSTSSTGTIVGVVVSLVVVVAVVGVLFMMRKKEQSRQRILTRGGRGGRDRQLRQDRKEQVHNNATFDDSNVIGNDNVDDSHVYRNDAYQNVPQSSLNRDQANNVDGGAIYSPLEPPPPPPGWVAGGGADYTYIDEDAPDDGYSRAAIEYATVVDGAQLDRDGYVEGGGLPSGPAVYAEPAARGSGGGGGVLLDSGGYVVGGDLPGSSVYETANTTV